MFDQKLPHFDQAPIISNNQVARRRTLRTSGIENAIRKIVRVDVLTVCLEVDRGHDVPLVLDTPRQKSGPSWFGRGEVVFLLAFPVSKTR